MSKTHILFTGANGGLGIEAIKHLLTQSSPVHVYAGVRSDAKAKELQEALKETLESSRSGSTLETILLNINDDESIKSAVKGLKQLDILVNNAAIANDGIAEKEGTRAMLSKTFDTNVFSAVVLIEAVLPLLHASRTERKRRPAIINVSSGLGSITDSLSPNFAYAGFWQRGYSVSKTALNSITGYFAATLADPLFISGKEKQPTMEIVSTETAFRVVSVDPGFNATPMNGNSGPFHPSVGGKVIADAALDEAGKNGIFITQQHGGGTLPW